MRWSILASARAAASRVEGSKPVEGAQILVEAGARHLAHRHAPELLGRGVHQGHEDARLVRRVEADDRPGGGELHLVGRIGEERLRTARRMGCPTA
jgi:hypothetical protein